MGRPLQRLLALLKLQRSAHTTTCITHRLFARRRVQASHVQLRRAMAQAARFAAAAVRPHRGPRLPQHKDAPAPQHSGSPVVLDVAVALSLSRRLPRGAAAQRAFLR